MSRLWKWLLIISICISPFVKGGESQTYTLIEDQTHLSILTPSLAERQTLKIRLPNGLEAYLVSDPDTNQAGAVLTIRAGSWDDPDEHPGLAHFLEHMLFLGTEKYPIESDYDRFIRESNGKSNAYTANDHTLYLFTVAPKAFEEGLDRFSYFFKKPLFNPSGISRELNAVNQEFAKNFNQDPMRTYYVSKELANPAHPFYRFCAGNSYTLSHVNQKTLQTWYEEHYSAHLMRLIVYGPFPIETLKNWVIEDFKDIAVKEREPFFSNEPILTDKTRGKIVSIDSTKGMQVLSLKWELSSLLPNAELFKPLKLVNFILSHEGPGSLLASLKKDRLAEYLTSETQPLGNQHLLFSLDIHLTPEGMHNIPVVIERCFQAIEFLKSQEIPLYLFDELKKTTSFRYQYQSREEIYSYLEHMGGAFVHEDLSMFPQPVLPQPLDPLLIREFLSYLTPDQTHFSVVAHQPRLPYSYREKWMGVPYEITAIPSEEIALWNQPQPYPYFHLPSPNPFIPEELTLIPSKEKPSKLIPEPMILIDNEAAKIYFAQDHYFKVPQTLWLFEIKTPAIESNNPIKMVLADLYLKSLHEALNPYRYSASLADFSYQISNTNNGISLSLMGYNDRAETLFGTILDHLKYCQPTKEDFEIFKACLRGYYRSFDREGPLQQGMEIYHSLLYSAYSTYPQRIAALEKISYEDFINYIDHLYDQTYVEGIFYGNISQPQALKMWKRLQTVLSSQIFPPEQRLIDQVLVLPNSGPYVIDLDLKSASHAAILAIESPVFSLKSQAAQQVLTQSLSAAFYSTLRTQQQTGYIVYSYSDELDKHLFTLFAVQSATHDPRDLLARFELFLENFIEEMADSELTEERFEFIRQSLIDTLEHSTQNLIATGYLLKTLAFDYEGDFDWINKRTQSLKDLSYEEFLDFTKQFLGKENKQRLAILMRGSTNQEFRYFALSNPQEIRQMSQYTHAD